MDNQQRIHLLDPLVAQRIAAGEVIERPASVVRELIDNAVDARASTVTVQVSDGGLERITVIDDGVGIPAQDLPLCCRSHATSKVSTLEDLYHLNTMGFRGEALYSIAASAKVTIASSFNGESAATVVVDNGMESPMQAGGPKRGTKVDVEHLFAAIPARRLFLKRPSTEATMCRSTIVEKAIAFPGIAFRFYDGDALKLDLPATTAKQRVLDTLANDKNLVPSEITELSDSAGRFSLYAVASTPACCRTDRSHIKIYINRRPVGEYALVQAVTYGYQEMLPGGFFPYCYLFVTVDPELVDFNIHPAKREAKLRNKAEIHHQIVVMVRQQIGKSLPRLHPEYASPAQQPELDSFGESRVSENPFSREEQQRQHPGMSAPNSSKPSDPDWFRRAREILDKPEQGKGKPPLPPEALQEEEFTYIGQVFDLFLIVQRGQSLYIIDQHAAHERIIYDEIRQQGGIQRLMVPLTFEVERDIDEFLTSHATWYTEYGLELARTGDMEWQLATIPALWKNIEGEVVSFISSYAAGDMEELEKRLYATIACHAAIRDGDTVDAITAESLVRKVFAMEHPVCPHGRTFVVEITKESLRQAVGRII